MQLDILEYPIVIDDDIAPYLSRFVAERGVRQAIVLADLNVEERATQLARTIAIGRGRRPRVLTFRLGERRKRLASAERVLDGLAANGAERSTLVVGVGGGVAHDLFGLAAALYMRGVPYVAVATTLVAMADAAIGGKTGVDLAAGKNLAGTFTDPIGVFCDLRALGTLRKKHLREGLAEIIKVAVIGGDGAFERIELFAELPLAEWPWMEIVEQAARTKADIVREDRRESGARALLNLGHTFAHAIELVSKYRISHGEAVAIGLRAAGLLALRNGSFNAVDHARVVSLLERIGLPVASSRLSVDRLAEAMLRDKKSRDGGMRFVVPRAIGDVEYGVGATRRALRSVLVRLGEPPGPNERVRILG